MNVTKAWLTKPQKEESMAEGIIKSLLLHLAKGAAHEFGRKFGESSDRAFVPHEPNAIAEVQTAFDKGTEI